MKFISAQAGLLLLGGVLLFSILFVADAQPLGSIVLEGSLPMNREVALKALDMEIGAVFKPEEAQKASERLRIALRDYYYPLAKVTWKAGPSLDGKTIQFQVQVSTGPKGRLRQLRFSGNLLLSNADLLAVVKTVPRERQWDRLLKVDRLKLEALDADQKALETLYHNAGFAEAEIGPSELEKPLNIDGFRLTWPIVREGPQYRVGYIGFKADQLPDKKRVEALLRINSGDVYNRDKLETARANLENYLLSLGHAFATVKLVKEFQKDKAELDVQFDVVAGKIARLRKVVITGNELTRDEIFIREIAAQPGEVFNPLMLQISNTNIQSLPMLAGARMDYVPTDKEGEYDLHVEVKEKKSGRFEIGVEYGEVQGPALIMNLKESNLSLKPPFRGDGLQAFLTATVGSTILRGDAGLANPQIGTSFWGVDGRVYYEDNENLSRSYNQKTGSGQILANYPVLPNLVLNGGPVVTLYELYEIDEQFAENLEEGDDDVQVTALSLGFDFYNTDQQLRPTSGGRLRFNTQLGTEALGGNADVITTRLSGQYHLTTYQKQVISVYAGMISAINYGDEDRVPLPLRTYLGGTENLRGFEYRSVSPRGEDGNLLGGETSWYTSVEYMIPVIKWLDIALYVDVGDVSLDSFSFSGEGPVSDVGVGLLIRADNFPVRFDLAAPVEVYEGDELNEKGEPYLSFSAGYRF
jgi:outer membrane protein insertion porin family